MLILLPGVSSLAWEGENAVKTGHAMLGETNRRDIKPGTIRGDYCINVGRNIIHGSDAVESVNHEIGLWFREEDLCDWKPCQEDMVYGDNLAGWRHTTASAFRTI